METEIILHRGYKGKYLENSLSSFENAIKENKSFETDIRVSKDKKTFMIHDESLDMLLNAKGKVIEYNSEELKRVKYLEDGSHLVPFEELLNLIKDNPTYSEKIFVHIKQLWNIKSVMESLDSLDFDLSERLRFFACDDITLGLVGTMKGHFPEYKVGLHLTENSPYKNEEHFERADFIWADEITKENITPEVVILAHSLGKPIYAISPELIPESVFNEHIERRWKELI